MKAHPLDAGPVLGYTLRMVQGTHELSLLQSDSDTRGISATAKQKAFVPPKRFFPYTEKGIIRKLRKAGFRHYPTRAAWCFESLLFIIIFPDQIVAENVGRTELELTMYRLDKKAMHESLQFRYDDGLQRLFSEVSKDGHWESRQLPVV